MEFVREKTLYEIISSKSLVLAYFWAVDCPSCHQADSFILDLENAYKGKITIVKINAQTEIELIKAFHIDAVPFFIIFKDAKVKAVVKGFKNRVDLEKRIRENIA